MQITLTRDALLAASGQARAAVETRNTIPILANVLLQATDEAVTLRGTDLDIEITAPVATGLETAIHGAITLPAATLHDIARKLAEGGKVTIATEPDGHRATLRSGRSRFVLPLQPAQDFPSLDAGAPAFSFALPGAALLAAIGRAGFAMSSEETRYYLNGVYMHRHEQDGYATLRLVATDGHRLALADLPAPEGSAGMPGIIIPRKTIAQIQKLGADAGEITLSGSASKIRADLGGPVIVSKLIDGSFPDYLRVIPVGNDKVAMLDAEELRAAVERVSTVAGDRGRAVRLDFGEGRLTLTVANPDAGVAVEEIEAEYAAEPITIGFNGRYVLEVLANLGTKGGKVEIALRDPGSPALVRAVGAADSLTVLMPMRV